jgi:sphinganine C4-monooxygenase
MHMNKFLYKHIHSVHHRLYVPYAYGALYNHPVEGFLLDSLGALVGEYLSGMTIRQAGLLFTVATLKTVDDHCGYRLPFDPLQLMTGNNADYHDIHHQASSIIHLIIMFVFDGGTSRSPVSKQTSHSHFSSTGTSCWERGSHEKK